MKKARRWKWGKEDIGDLMGVNGLGSTGWGVRSPVPAVVPLFGNKPGRCWPDFWAEHRSRTTDRDPWGDLQVVVPANAPIRSLFRTFVTENNRGDFPHAADVATNFRDPHSPPRRRASTMPSA